ncbi:MAG: D-2-hydroxyacid dehydrogenase [Longimicrobiales bacterium]|nr:D-2-hydroxyacid dehydrogenase [Longimicrobiales bacterium]
MAHFVIDLHDQRPVWSQPEWFAREVRAALPESWTLAVLRTPSEGTGDGATRVHPDVLAAVRDARVYLGFGVPEALLKAAPALEWVHSGSAGVGSSLTPEMLRRDLVFTNSAGIHGPPMAEAVLGMILYFSRGFDFARAAQARGSWDTTAFYAADAPLVELSASTVGILGLGGIGREVAWRCRALGARVLGLKRTPGGAVPEGVEALHGEAGFHRVLAESDFLAVTAPDTPATRGMMNAEAFGRMKPGSVYLNVARGRIADEAALLDALRSGRLRGAGLDVFAREPLPADSPFWQMENVLLTPHVSPVTRHFWRREADLVLHNLRRLLEGRPGEMRNVVDRAAGY